MNQVNTKKHIHIVGICGVATSAIAIAFNDIGWKVTGSDKGFFPPVSTELESYGIDFYAGWHPENFSKDKIGIPDIIMTGGSGTSPNNPEVIYANEHNIPVYTYPEIIQKYFIKNNSIVTVGTWGKTTTSALLSYILINAGLNPSYFTGGLSLSHKTGAITDSKWSVVEGDEYQVSISDKRPKFVYYSPTHLLLTSLSWDHADLYENEESYYKVFRELIENVSANNGLIIANKDRENVIKIIKNTPRVVLYGKAEKKGGAQYTYSDVEQTEKGLDFNINYLDKDYAIHSPLIGKFQAENITGCFAIAHQIGIPPEKIVGAINDFMGLKRRLEKRYIGQVTVIDDIAHSPDKVKSILENLRGIYRGKIYAIFEPNIGGRQRETIKKYDDAFINSNEVIIPRLSKLKISDEKNNTPIEGDELSEIISKTHSNAIYIGDDSKLIDYIMKNVKTNDVVVFMGSHGFRGMIEEIITSLRRQSL